MIILGVTHPISRNVAAAIVVDGKLIAAAEEERFTRIKGAPTSVAVNAMDYVIKAAGIKPGDVDLVATSSKGPTGGRGLGSMAFKAGKHAISGMMQGLSPRAEFGYGFFSAQLELGLDRYIRSRLGSKKILYVPHHLCHAASACYVSGFKRSLVMTLDGRGELSSGLLGFYDNGEIEVMRSLTLKESLGHVYGEFTKAIGFRYHEDEGKTMGLAPYGKPIDSLLSAVEVKDLKVRVDWKKLGNLGVPPGTFGPDPTKDIRKNLAATGQRILENAAVDLVSALKQNSAESSLAIAGGVALNIDMNSKILKSGLVKEIFVQPGSHDAGCAIGAALFAYHEETGSLPSSMMRHAYLGPDVPEEEAKEAISRFKLQSELIAPEAVPGVASEILAKGKLLAWVNGRLEFGPRALGARSLLASPTDRGMWGKVNMAKGREWWRPLAPSIIEEEAHGYFEEDGESPFMLLKFNTTEIAKERMPAVVHVDGSTRPQIVSRTQNPLYWEAIREFQKLTGVPALINTSLNLRGEPIACNIIDVLKTFFASGIDYALIGDYLLKKPNA